MADTVNDIADEEILYRSVRQEEYRLEAGQLIIQSTAFNARSQRISFDRALLRTAEESRKADDQAVFSVTAAEVRSIEGARIQSSSLYYVEVVASPIENNSAHAHVEAIPHQETMPPLSAEGFKRLKRELAKLAQIVLPPLR